MGSWNLETWKLDEDGNAIDLNMDDLGHIADQILHGFTAGEIGDEGEDAED